MYTIYKITNLLNGKAYIGFDSNWPARKAVHICEAITRQNKQYPLYRAIAKYGKDNFKWEILYQNEDRDHTLNVMENKMIIEHNTHYKDGHGYNMTYGGEGALGWIPSEETKKKISQSNKGKMAWNKGKPSPWTSERNKKRKGISTEGLKKQYKITDPNGKEYFVLGLKDFCRQYKLSNSDMCSVANNKLKHYKKWKCEKIIV